MVLAIGSIAVALVVTVLVTVWWLTPVPMARHFAMYGVAVYDLEKSCTGIDTTAGTSITFHWWDSKSVPFGAWSCPANNIVYEAWGRSGNGSVTSQGGVYEFGAICPGSGQCIPANVTGNYTGPGPRPGL